jgi:23S rRNA-intervening sequence protein
MQDFRRLLVWQRAHTFALDMHRAIDAFPRGNTPSSRSKCAGRRNRSPTTLSRVALQHRERNSRGTSTSAMKSASEVDYQLQLAHDLGAIDTATWQPLAREVVELRKMLWGLRRTILATPDSRDPRENNPTRRDPEA